MTLLEARLLTGRMHQIRVHCAHHGHPVVGDLKYGRQKLSDGDLAYMALHAYHIDIHCPELGLELEVTAPYHDRLAAFISVQGLQA
jgi:23S rRNA-/tRNA-specific pseudouridylate synthase